MTSIKKLYQLIKMVFELKGNLKKFPQLSVLEFQGKKLSYFTTLSGFIDLAAALFNKNFDPIGFNHGFKRLKLINYPDDIIWSYPTIYKEVFTDDFSKLLEHHYDTIKKEILECIEFVEKFPDSDTLANGGTWNYIPLFDKSGKFNSAIKSICPTLYELLTTIDINLIFGFCFISILDEDTTIKSHKGSSNLRQRYHLGIEIPKGISRIKIGKTWINWENGRAFGFNDSVTHEVEHFAKNKRIILVIDTWNNSVPKELIQSIKDCKKILNFGKIDE